VLEELASLYPAPAFIRSDNGPECIAHALRKWCQRSGTSTAFLEPEHRGRTALPCRSTVGSGMNSSIPNCLPRWRSPGLGQPPALGVQHPQASFRHPGAYAPRGSSSSCCITTNSHCAWTNEGAHVNRACKLLSLTTLVSRAARRAAAGGIECRG